MKFDESQATQLRDYAKNLPETERKSFISKFQSLPDEKQGVVINRLFGESTPVKENNKPLLDVGKSVVEGISSALRPSPSDISVGGLDPIQRFGQTTLQGIYGQGREQMINQMLGEQKSPGTDWGRGVAGVGVDIGTGLLMGAGSAAGRLAGKAISPIGKIAGSIGNKAMQTPELAMNIWKSGGNLKGVERGIANVEGAISKITPNIEAIKSKLGSTPLPEDIIKSAQSNSTTLGKYGESQISEAKRLAISASNKKSEEMTSGLKQMSKDLYESVVNDNKVAREKAISFRAKAIKQYDISVNAAEDRAIKSGKSITAHNYYTDVVKPTLDEFAQSVEMKGSTATKAVDKLQGVASELANKPASKNIGFKEIKDIKNSVYDSNDWVANKFFQRHSEFVSKFDPELNKITSDYRPVFEANKWAKNNFQTMTSDTIQNSTGALDRITKAISNGKSPSAKDLSYLKIIEEGSPEGIFKGVGKIGEASKGKALDIDTIKKQTEAAKKQILSQVEDKIEMIKSSINEDRSTLLTKGYDEASKVSSERAFLESKKLGFVSKKAKMESAISKLRAKEKNLARYNKIRMTLIATAAGTGLYTAFNIPKFVGYHATQALENAPMGD